MDEPFYLLFYRLQIPDVPAISQKIVKTEKNPKLTAAIAEKPNAKRFLNFNCRITETTATTVTISKSIPKTIYIHPPCVHAKLIKVVIFVICIIILLHD